MFIVNEQELLRWNRVIVAVVRATRDETGMSQLELADRLHVSRGQTAG